MNGRESLAQTVTLLSFVSAGMIAAVNFSGSVSQLYEQPPSQDVVANDKQRMSISTRWLPKWDADGATDRAPHHDIPAVERVVWTDAPTPSGIPEPQPFSPGRDALAVRPGLNTIPAAMLNLTQNAALIQETLVADTVAPGTVAQRAIAPTPASPSKIVVDLSDRSLTLHREGYPDQQFPIAVGRVGWETPKGEFEVINKQMHPIWQNPLTQEIVPSGPNNPLGTRWIGFWTDGRNELGFHGTNETDLIGQAVSHGCIRMENRHIQELYPHVDVGTPVSIQP